MVKTIPFEFNDKQLHIIEVAIKLFSEKGFSATSIRDISKEAGINLAMINYYFLSKSNLLISIFAYMGDVSKKYLDDALINMELSPFEKMDAIIENYVKFAIDHKSFLIIMMRQQFNESSPEVQDKIFQLKERYWRIFSMALEDAKRKNLFNESADITTIVSIIMGTVNYLIRERLFLQRIFQHSRPEASENYNENVIKACMDEVKKIIRDYIKKVEP